ncbi:MAG: hypothetical protein IKP02_10245 [Paludibacteraceae bacterium]|nr:hypothetical protein [Paludibacteraceae bacterium]
MAKELVTCPHCGTQFRASKGHPILGAILGVAAGVAATVATGGGAAMLAICAIGGGLTGNGLWTKESYTCPKCKKKFGIPQEGDNIESDESTEEDDNQSDEINEEKEINTEK